MTVSNRWAIAIDTANKEWNRTLVIITIQINLHYNNPNQLLYSTELWELSFQLILYIKLQCWMAALNIWAIDTANKDWNWTSPNKTSQECETALTSPFWTLVLSMVISCLGLHLGISHGVGHGVGYVLVTPHGVAHGVSHFQSSFHIHRFLTVILTRGRYRAARAAKKWREELRRYAPTKV